VHIGARATVHLVGVLRFSPSIETAKDFFIRNTVSFGEVLKNCGEPSLWVWELLITYCLAIALMYTIIFRFILTFTKKDFLKVTFAVMDREFAIQVLRRSFTTLFADTTSTKRLGQQQVYESFLRSQIPFLFSRKLGGGWGKGGTLQDFRWYTHAPFAINAALLGNLLVCFAYLEFQLHRHILIKLFLYTILQHQLEVSKIRSTLAFLFLEMISHNFLWGFTLKRSIRRRILKNFMFCIGNLISVFGNCSTGCPKGGT